MTFVNVLKTAYRGVISNKLRGALTTLGIMIGVASVIVMLALGNGARAAVDQNFRSLGSDEIQIFEAQTMKNNQFVPVGKILSYEDGLNMVQQVPLIDHVDMTVYGTGKVRYGRNSFDASFTSTTASALQTLTNDGTLQPVNWSGKTALTPASFIGEGRFFTSAEVIENAEVCVIGYQTALDLFEGEDPINQTVWANRRPCTVIGVFADLETTDPSQRYQSNPNYSFYLPISTAVQNLFDKEPDINITAHVKDQSQMDAAKEAITNYLRQRHGISPDVSGKYTDDFDMNTRSDLLGSTGGRQHIFNLIGSHGNRFTGGGRHRHYERDAGQRQRAHA